MSFYDKCCLGINLKLWYIYKAMKTFTCLYSQSWLTNRIRIRSTREYATTTPFSIHYFDLTTLLYSATGETYIRFFLWDHHDFSNRPSHRRRPEETSPGGTPAPTAVSHQGAYADVRVSRSA